MSYFDTGLNTAPEHGTTPIGSFGDGGPIPIGAGTRPEKPADKIGTVSPAGPTSERPYRDPHDPNNDMDDDGPGDLSYGG